MCLTPINLKKETFMQKLRDTYHMQEVPCGRCLECMRQRVDSWHLRLSNQLKSSKSAYFVTLTYEDLYLPFSENGLMSLSVPDFQKFMKRCRKERSKRLKKLKDKGVSEPAVKYFTALEYGEITARPHFHSILFNMPIDIIEQSWKHGHIHVGQVTDASIRYTLKYALKRAGKWKKSSDNDDDRIPEKALMSRGIGLDYLTDEMIQYHKNDLTRPSRVNGTTVPLARYYRDKIFTDAEKLARNKLIQKETNTERFETISSPFFPQRVEKMYRDSEKKLKETD